MDGLFFSAARNSSYFLSRARFQREKLCDMHFEHDVAYLRHVHRATRFRYQRRFLLFLFFILFLIFISLIFFLFSLFHFTFSYFIYLFIFLLRCFPPSFLPFSLYFPFSYFTALIFFLFLFEKKLSVFFLFYFSFVISVLFSFSFFLFFISFDVSSRQGHSSFSRALGLPLIRHVSNSRNVVTHE